MKKNKIIRHQGFTLIELMIVLVILGIISAIAFPAYDRYKLKGYRMDAISYLTQAAAIQENWYAENATYTSNVTTTGGATSTKKHYNITIIGAGGQNFTIRATATGTQVSDTDCVEFSIDNIGRKLAKKSDNSDNSKKCWGS